MEETKERAMDMLKEVCGERGIMFLQNPNNFTPAVVFDKENRIVIISTGASDVNICKLINYVKNNFPLFSRKSFQSA